LHLYVFKHRMSLWNSYGKISIISSSSYNHLCPGHSDQLSPGLWPLVSRFMWSLVSKIKKKWKIFKGMLIKTTFLCVDKCKILQCKYFLFLFNCLKSFKHVSLQDLGDKKKKRLILGLPNQTTHCSSVRHSLAIMRMPSLVTHV